MSRSKHTPINEKLLIKKLKVHFKREYGLNLKETKRYTDEYYSLGELYAVDENNQITIDNIVSERWAIDANLIPCL